LAKRLCKVEDELTFAMSSDYIGSLDGTIGLDCSLEQSGTAEGDKGEDGS